MTTKPIPIDQLLAGQYEFSLTVVQQVYYSLERELGHLLLRRPPPGLAEPNLLNLGCGPRIFPGWVNADDYALKRRLRERAFRPNWSLDITRHWRCQDNHWDGIFTEHVLEHVTYSQAVRVLKEGLRTLRSGAWIRISVPDLAKYVAYYNGSTAETEVGDFPYPAVAISFLTQMHQHRSTWDGDLMVGVLTEVGFADAKIVKFCHGSDPRVILDDPDKAHESFYVEARKALR